MKQVSFLLEEEVLQAWKEYCEDKCINSSKLLRKVIIKYLEENGIINNQKAEKHENEIIHYDMNGHYVCNPSIASKQEKLTKEKEKVTCANCIRNMKIMFDI